MQNRKWAPPPPRPGSIEWLRERIALGEDHTETITLTPELATELLTRNGKNRNYRPSHAQKIARDIIAGHWEYTHEPIIISETGVLNDGQHRCHAVLLAKLPVKIKISFGASEESRLALGQSAPRLARDRLQMLGYPSSTALTATIKHVLAFEKSGGRNLGGLSVFTAAEIEERAEGDLDLAESVRFGASHTNNSSVVGKIRPSVVCCAHYLMSRVNRAAAEDYLTKVCRGEGISRGDPAYAVRDALLSRKSTAPAKIEMLWRGWHAHIHGRRLLLIKIFGGDLPPLK